MKDGYVWWYVDGISDDGNCGITVIAFIGSVFSPYYFAARRRGLGDPLNHCSINVALYGRKRAWAMTERGRAAVARDAASFTVGPSSLAWDGACLTIKFDEITVPIPTRLRGTVRVHAEALASESFAIDAAGRHIWRPVAPRARIEAELQSPALRWSGDGYFDSNSGSEPLEKAFASWHWSRASLARGAAVLYETQPLQGPPVSLALRFGADGRAASFAPPPLAPLPGTLWRIRRQTRSEAPATALSTLEDTPFYARSKLSAHLLGEPVTAMHESLSLTRFKTRLVQGMLPFRMPRRAGW